MAEKFEYKSITKPYRPEGIQEVFYRGKKLGLVFQVDSCWEGVYGGPEGPGVVFGESKQEVSEILLERMENG